MDRIYVHRKVYDQFESALVKEVASFQVGDDTMDPNLFIGPLARERQLGFLEHLTNHAVRRGAELLIGGKRMTEINGKKTKGWFFEPTVIGHCNHTMEIMHRESFGPIVGLQKVNNDDDAVSLMNDNLFGLAASVYTNDEERAIEVLKEVKVGTCYWNACDRVSPYLPWTGVKHSGFGSTLGLDGIRNFIRPRSWHLRSPPAQPLTREQAASRELYSGHALAPSNLDGYIDTHKPSKLNKGDITKVFADSDLTEKWPIQRRKEDGREGNEEKLKGEIKKPEDDFSLLDRMVELPENKEKKKEEKKKALGEDEGDDEFREGDDEFSEEKEEGDGQKPRRK